MLEGSPFLLTGLQRGSLFSSLQGLDWAHSCSVPRWLSLHRCQTALATPHACDELTAGVSIFKHLFSACLWASHCAVPQENLPRAALPRVPVLVRVWWSHTGSCLTFWLAVGCRQPRQPRLWDEGVTRFSAPPAGVTLILRCFPASPLAVEFPCSHTPGATYFYRDFRGRYMWSFSVETKTFHGGEGGDGFMQSSGNAHHLHPPGGHTGKPFPGLPPSLPLRCLLMFMEEKPTRQRLPSVCSPGSHFHMAPAQSLAKYQAFSLHC